MSQYFPKPYRNFGENVKVALDLSSYGTTSDLKIATGVDTSKLASKSDLFSLKDEVDKTIVDKIKTIPVDLN